MLDGCLDVMLERLVGRECICISVETVVYYSSWEIHSAAAATF